MPPRTLSIETIFQHAVDNKASDIHLVVGKPPMVRIDGVLSEIADLPVLDDKSLERLVLSILEVSQRDEFLKRKELDSSYALDAKARFRVNCHFERGNMGLVARVVSNVIPTMQELDLPEVVYKLVEMKQGFILVTGPTGCGKSTSLAAMIRHINENRVEHIVTLEDPIEYMHQPIKSIIRQRQLGTDFNTFHGALKHIVRQDPNVILVGEMRDLETIGAAITLAETGHLVMATLHTNNASQTIDRIIDVFPPHQQNQVRTQLSLTLKGVISQRLLPKIGGGRLAAREVLINTPAVANMIRESKVPQIKTALQTGEEEGMMTMDQDIKRLYQRRMVDEETARVYISDPKAVRL